MRRILIVNIICFVSIIAFAQTIENRIVPPDGYIRKKCDGNSFAAYLRQLPLFPEGSKVKLYNGQEKQNQSAAYSVINMEIGNLDLQQCADAVIRLRAEYLWVQKRYGEIKFNFTSGFPVEYTKWAEGKRIKVSGNKAEWYAAGGRDYSYKTFRKYLDMVFMYAGTASLAKELQTVTTRRCFYQRRLSGACCNRDGHCYPSNDKEKGLFIGTKLYAGSTDSYLSQSVRSQSVSLVRTDRCGRWKSLYSGMDIRKERSKAFQMKSISLCYSVDTR